MVELEIKELLLQSVDLSYFLKEIPWWYYIVAFFVSLYHAYRGYTLQHSFVRQQKDANKIDETYWTESKLFWVRDFYDTVFYFVCSFAGFILLSLAFSFLTTTNIDNLSGGLSALIIFLFTTGFLGILGILPHIIQLGKLR